MLTHLEEVKPNSIWIGNSGARFRVQAVQKESDAVWVYYRREDSLQEYSCLLEAFEHRFSLYSNQKE